MDFYKCTSVQEEQKSSSYVLVSFAEMTDEEIAALNEAAIKA